MLTMKPRHRRVKVAVFISFITFKFKTQNSFLSRDTIKRALKENSSKITAGPLKASFEVCNRYHGRGGEKHTLRLETPGPSLLHYKPSLFDLNRINEVKTGLDNKKPHLGEETNQVGSKMAKQKPEVFPGEGTKTLWHLIAA